MDNELFKAIQILAIKEVESESFNFFYRRTCRWFSKEFHTPLVEVEGYDMEYVLKTYFEDLFYTAYNSEDDEKLQHYQEIRSKILMSEFELKKLKEVEDELNSSDDKFVNEAISKGEDWEAKLLKEVPIKKGNDYELVNIPDSFSLGSELEELAKPEED